MTRSIQALNKPCADWMDTNEGVGWSKDYKISLGHRGHHFRSGPRRLDSSEAQSSGFRLPRTTLLRPVIVEWGLQRGDVVDAQR